MVVADVDEHGGAAGRRRDRQGGRARAEAVAVDVTNEERRRGDGRRAIGGTATAGSTCSCAAPAIESCALVVDTQRRRVAARPRRQPEGPVPVHASTRSRPWSRAGGGSVILARLDARRDRLARVRGVLRVEGRAREPGQAGRDRARARRRARERRLAVGYDTGLFMKVVGAGARSRRAQARWWPSGRRCSGSAPADEVCDAVVFLAVDESTYISGAVIPLDGGLAARGCDAYLVRMLAPRRIEAGRCVTGCGPRRRRARGRAGRACSPTRTASAPSSSTCRRRRRSRSCGDPPSSPS